MIIMDTIKDVFDWLINSMRVLGCSWALQDTSPSNVLIYHRFKIFRLPERVFLEKELKVLVKDRNEGYGLLSAALTQLQEVLHILSRDQLLTCLRISLKHIIDDLVWLVQLRVALDEGRFAWSGGKSTLKASNEVACKALERRVNPSRLVLDIHKVNHALHNFAVGHIFQVHNLAG